MKPDQKSIRIGATVILFACAMRFLGNSLVTDVTRLMLQPSVSSILFYMGTGRVSSQTVAQSTEPPATEAAAVFSAEDAALVSLTNHPGYPVDIPTLLEQPLDWELIAREPTVLIVHTHTSESYENTEGYEESAYYRTLDPNYNMISIGKHLCQRLQARGIGVIHDTTVHDDPSYTDAYDLSRKTVEAYLEKYPSIQMVLDLHRDAYEDSAGNQLSSVVSIQGKASARLMIVAGTNGGGEPHENWQDNLSMAVKLQAALEGLYPGLCRDISLRYSSFNQDLSAGALLIEVGTAGDTRQQALYAAELLADGVAALAYGAN